MLGKMNNKEDKFKSFFQERLQNYEHPIREEEELWASLQKELAGKRKRLPLRLIKTGLGIAAAFLVAVLLFFLYPDPHAPVKTAEPILPPENKNKITIQKEEKLLADVLIPKKDKRKQTSGISTPPQESNSSINSSDNDANNRDKDRDKKEDQIEETVKKETFIEPFDNQDEENKIILPKKHKKLSLALSVGNSLIANSPTTIDRPKNDDYLGGWFGNAGSIVNDGHLYDIEYAVPITGSILLRKQITKSLALETGLSYTFLSSKEERTTGKGPGRNNINLHYLGIPVKAVYTFYDNKSLSLYCATGIMAEKCIYGKIKTTDYTQSQTANLSIPELQWSVSGSIGINYHIRKSWGIFAEPGIGYYFDDKSNVMTIRKDKPFNFNLQGGLRFFY
jgi:hypothetical protein